MQKLLPAFALAVAFAAHAQGYPNTCSRTSRSTR